MKNITLSADERLINKAREKAQKEKTTLNANFRRWLKQYVSQNLKSSEYHNLMQELGYVNSGKYFSRDELNER